MHPIIRCLVILPLLVLPAFAQLRVNVMPGYPNAPNLTPQERRQVRPSVSGGVQNPYFVWGNVNGGQGNAPAGATYTWAFSSNQNLSVITDGSLTGAVTAANLSFVAEEVRFELLNASTRETVTATLTVDAGPLGIAAKSVQFDVIALADPASDEPLEQLQIDVNIAIEEGKRWLYLNQNADGSWTSNVNNYVGAVTGFALWGLQNQRHLPTNDVNEDIYAEHVQRGLDYLFRNLQVLTGAPALTAPRALAALGAIADGVSDLNQNNQCINLAPSNRAGYASPIVCSAIIASAAPDRVVTVSPAAGAGAIGMTYRQVVEDAIDWLGHTQSQGGTTSWAGRGGWYYDPYSTANVSDMSINSWAFVAMEGAQDVFNVVVPDWIKVECEHALVAQQNASAGGFGYTSANSCSGAVQQMMATSGAGLSGLVLALTEGPFATPGAVIGAASGSLNSIAAKRTAGVAYIGQYWHELSGGPYCNGHFRNYYSMWTIARALRLTAKSLGLPTGTNLQLVNGGVSYDWETGESNGNGQVPGQGTPPAGNQAPVTREGYFNWLVRHQTTTGAAASRGYWRSGINWLGDVVETSCAVLILTPRVFVEPCPQVVNIPIVSLAPPANTGLPPGSQVVLSGRAVAESPERPIVAVLVDGQPVDSLDAAGNFFKTVTVQGGTNVFTIRAVDTCGSSDVNHQLVGGTAVNLFNTLSNVSLGLAIQYQNTTFNLNTDQLVVQARAVNVSTDEVDAPILLVIDNITQPSVTVANPDGWTPQQKPYFIFLDPAVQARLLPGQSTPPKTLVFNNPNHVGVNFARTWMADTNGPPFFVSTPPVTAGAGVPWTYAPVADDPDNDVLSFSLTVAPAGMTVDPQSGSLAWTPAASDIGAHNVVLRAADGRGGSATQSFVLDVLAVLPNRPPVFTSAPSTHASVGAVYAYAAQAIDPDNDPLTFSLVAGPPGLLVSAAGAVSWDLALPGSHPVAIRASDPAGAFAEQAWVLAVGAASTNPGAPQIFGVPAAQAVANNLYYHQAIGSAPDPGETHTWSLPVAPTGMVVDPQSGLVQWTPGVSQVGAHPVQLVLADSGGASTAQAWTIQVLAQAPNRPPVITTLPPLQGTEAVPYAYDVDATDPDLDSLIYSLVGPPPGMTINPATGQIGWTPTATGSVFVAVRATDPAGAFGSQVWFLDILPPNHPPAITSTAPLTAVVGAQYAHDVQATDPDSDPLNHVLTTAPAGMTINAANGWILWTPSAAQNGPNPVTVVVDDGRGGSDTRSFTVTVGPDNVAPQLSILVQPTTSPVALINTPVFLCVQASDNVGVVARTLTIDGTPVALDNQGCAWFTATAPATYALAATASDAAGNVGTTTATLPVADPAAGPVSVTLTSPAPGTVITGPTAIVADVAAQSAANLSWQVTLRNLRTGLSRILAQGTGVTSGTPLATVDPTLLPNDGYRVELFATNLANSFTLPFDVAVAGDHKLGNFVYETADLSLPVANLPVTISRRYDSLDTSPGDFGNGWSLGLNVRVSDVPLENVPNGPESFRIGTRVYVTRPDGRRVGFTTNASAPSWIFGFVVNPYFTADEGVQDTLELAVPESVFALQGLLQTGLFNAPWNPDRYKFKTREGVTYTISEANGLEQAVDINGNTLTVTPQGIFSSLGTSVGFQRDAAGRITKVTEPIAPGSPGPPAELNYVYDPAGRLVAFVDQLGNQTTYLYEDAAHPDYLTQIKDPLNRPVIRNVYDADGRLTAQCGPTGDPLTLAGCTTFTLDPGASLQTIFDGRGNRLDLFLDARGNVLTERRHVPGGGFADTVNTYWPGTDRLHTTTDPDGLVTAYTYDAAGNVTQISMPGGAIWGFTWNSCAKVATQTDPLGNTTAFTYDTDCNLTQITDALGHSTLYTYNNLGQLTGIADTVGNIWSFTYDAYGYPASETDPQGRTSYTVYSPDGGLQSVIDRAGNSISFLYDAAHRVTNETWTGPVAYRAAFTYDASGRLLTATDPEAALTLAWWPTGLLRSVTSAIAGLSTPAAVTYGRDAGGTLVPGYDGNGNVTAVTDSFGGLTEYSYDHANRLSGVLGHPLGGAVHAKRLDVLRSPGGLVVNATRGASLGAPQPVVLSNHLYLDPANPTRASRIEHLRASTSAVLEAYDFQHDPAGRLLSSTDTEGLHGYTYDGLGRLLTADHPSGGAQPDETYAYDAAGNRQASHRSAFYTYGYETPLGGQELLGDATYTYTYDANGRLARRVETATGIADEMSYDLRGRLVLLRRLDAQSVVMTTRRWRYDALNRRIAEIVDRAATRYFVYDGSNPVAEVDPAGQVLARHLFGRETDTPLATESGGTATWLLGDLVRTVRTAVDSGRTITQHLVYDSFGNVLGSTAGAPVPRFTFQAREFETAFGLGYFRARTYDANTGRFLSEDPEYPNDYVFAQDCPTVARDPSGRSVFSEYACILKLAIEKVNVLRPRLEATAAVFLATAAVLESATPGNIAAAQSAAQNLVDKLTKWKPKEWKKLFEPYNCGGR